MPAGQGRISLTPWMSGSMTTAAMFRRSRPAALAGRRDLRRGPGSRACGSARRSVPRRRARRRRGCRRGRPSAKATKPVRSGSPVCWRNCTAIFSAHSTAVEPSSEKKTRSSVSAGKNAQRRSASSLARGWVKPRNEVWAIFPSWRRMAASRSPGGAWPWMLVQIEELPSR